MTALSGIAKLRVALWQMERDLGLEQLSRTERDVLYAFHAAVTAGVGPVSTEDALRAGRVDEMRHASVSAALSRLLELGYLEQLCGDHPAYRVTDLPPAAPAP